MYSPATGAAEAVPTVCGVLTEPRTAKDEGNGEGNGGVLTEPSTGNGEVLMGPRTGNGEVLTEPSTGKGEPKTDKGELIERGSVGVAKDAGNKALPAVPREPLLSTGRG